MIRNRGIMIKLITNAKFFVFSSRSGLKEGYAAITMTILVLVVSLTIISSFTFFALKEVAVNRAYIKSIEAHYISESGLEDLTYRIILGKQFLSSEVLSVGAGSTTITVVQNGNQRIIRSEGIRDNYQQNLETRVDLVTTGANFFYGVQVDAGGVTMLNGAQVNGNLFSNGSISGGEVTGNATVAVGLSELPTVEWPMGCTSSCGNSDNFFATTTTNQDIAQSFIATASGPLNKISVFLGKVGSPTADITLRITIDVSNHPDSSQISNADATIIGSSVGVTPSWINVTFLTPPNLTIGSKYWIVLDYSKDSTVNYWNWQKDNTDGYANNTGKKTNNWSSGGANWVNVGGDLAFRLWIGGINNQISDSTIGGVGRAPVFVNVTAGGSACPNANCIVSSDPPQPLPISDGVIQDWRDVAEVGGTINGNYTVSGSQSLGPKKINGDLKISGGSTLTVTGTVWVTGNLEIENNATVKLSSGYGANSGMIVVDGLVDISNNVIMSGSGQTGSFLMVVAGKNDPTHQVMDISNNLEGAIYYAGHGRIHFNNNAATKEATAYGLDLDNNVTVTYESGLQNVNFTSGPSGGYSVKYWKEVE